MNSSVRKILNVYQNIGNVIRSKIAMMVQMKGHAMSCLVGVKTLFSAFINSIL